MKTLLLTLIVFAPFMAHAELDKYSKEALGETQNLLTSPKERQDAIKGDAKATDADKKAEALVGGGQNKEELYSIASKVMEKVAAESQGDPTKMQQLLMEAQKNPEAFYNKYFSAEEKARLRNLAGKVEGQKKTSPAPR